MDIFDDTLLRRRPMARHHCSATRTAVGAGGRPARHRTSRASTSALAEVAQSVDMGPLIPIASYNYLNDSLSNTKNPNACGTTLLCALMDFGRFIHMRPLNNAGVSKYDALWTTIYGFLIAERTDDEFQTLKDRLYVCSCSFEQDMEGEEKRAMHERFKEGLVERNSSEKPNHAYAFMSVLCGLLSSVLPHTKDVCFMPFDPDRMVKTLLQWQRCIGGTAILNVLSIITYLGGPSMMKSVIDMDAMRFIVIQPLRAALDKMMATFEKPSSKIRARTAKRARGTDVDGEYGGIESLYVALDRLLKHALKDSIEANQQLIEGLEMQALQLCSIMLYLLRVPMIERGVSSGEMCVLMKNALARDASFMIYKLDMDLPCRPRVLLHPAIKEAYDKRVREQQGVGDRRQVKGGSGPCGCGACGDGKWRSGYDDYEALVKRFCNKYRGPKPRYISRK
ncbi:hypothetical protein CVT24_001774 [Panaeolus cyanescens]|uniref:Uncharacterized protein n=1 Tax=Panaeolus cyanescens TaxID=181874 RepID=A0A409YUD6_9AGAR|nr:hypothetical protein CVT24_001774 [Panaeolus cyanescens]